MFEGKSFKVQRLEETVEKMKEVEDNNAKTIDDIIGCPRVSEAIHTTLFIHSLLKLESMHGV